MKIKSINARQILDSRGNPTVEADVILENNSIGRAAVPSGASTGSNEALELRDNDPKLFGGKSVLKAIENIETTIAKALYGKDVEDQQNIDNILIELDGTENKSNLGANAILAVSLASAHAGALCEGTALFHYISRLSQQPRNPVLPLPMMNVFNGGKHGGWATDIQEFMILPVSAQNFTHAVQMGSEVFHSLASVLHEKGYPTTVGDEGGFAPQVKEGNTEVFGLISKAIENAGYKLHDDFVFAIDAASSEFFTDNTYNLTTENKKFTTSEMIDWLVSLSKQYPIVSIEDGLQQEDWDGWMKLTQTIGDHVQIVGDDLLVTNTSFLQKAIQNHSGNAILVKVNQIGTLTETIEAVDMAHQAGWNAIISHRSGETEDTTIAHIAVGLGTGQIKTGSLSRTDRTSKYNELLRIEELLNEKGHAEFAGRKILEKYL